MTLLPQLLDKDEFVLLRHYLTDDTDKRKLFQLSRAPPTCSISIWFIGLTGLRSGKRKNRGRSGEAQNWQAPLWKALVEYTAALGQPRWHRANLYQRFIQTLESATACPRGCRPAFLFAAFPRYRQCISEHCRRWVNILKSISFY